MLNDRARARRTPGDDSRCRLPRRSSLMGLRSHTPPWRRAHRGRRATSASAQPVAALVPRQATARCTAAAPAYPERRGDQCTRSGVARRSRALSDIARSSSPFRQCAAIVSTWIDGTNERFPDTRPREATHARTQRPGDRPAADRLFGDFADRLRTHGQPRPRAHDRQGHAARHQETLRRRPRHPRIRRPELRPRAAATPSSAHSPNGSSATRSPDFGGNCRVSMAECTPPSW